MAKRRMSKKYKNRLIVFGTISLFCIVYCVGYILYNVYTIHDLLNEKRKLENEYIALQEEAEELKIDIEKLNDEEYLANYAREHYLYSKSGEYIFKLENINSSKEELEDNINKRYMMMALSVLMILLFIYIIVKGNRPKKKRKKKK